MSDLFQLEMDIAIVYQDPLQLPGPAEVISAVWESSETKEAPFCVSADIMSSGCVLNPVPNSASGEELLDSSSRILHLPTVPWVTMMMNHRVLRCHWKI